MAKAKKELSLKSWDDANEAVRRLAEIERLEAKSSAVMNQEIDKVKLHYETEMKPLSDERKQIEKDLAVFAKANRIDFQGKQSKVLAFGVLMFRKSKAMTIHSVVNTVAALERIYGADANEYLKVTKKVEKDALEKLNDEELAQIGCSRKEKETFAYEIKWDVI